jgi:intraflagellar transport protein 52
MEKETLRLIKPQFETPLPPLRPAVFQPNFRLPAHPRLELFDLDDAFSSSQTRLLQIANKCTDADLEYYVKECGLTLGIESVTTKTAKEILFSVFAMIVEYKKVNNDQDIM